MVLRVNRAALAYVDVFRQKNNDKMDFRAILMRKMAHFAALGAIFQKKI